MASDCNYNCAELPEHEIVDCNQYPVGGIDAFAVLDCNHGITDWTSTSQWNSAIASNKATIITQTKGELPDPSPVEGDNPVGSGPEQILDNFDRTFTWTDGNVTAGNIDMVNRLNRWKGALVFREANEGRITVIDETGTFVVFRSVANTKKTKQMFKGTYKWTAFDEPAIYDEPAGIFD